MKKLISLLAVAICASAVSYAQDVTKQVVNVEAFNFSSSDFNVNEANVVRNNVIQSIQNTNRILVVDLQQQDAIKSEAERRKSESAINDNHAVSDITQLNANYILKGTLNTIVTEKKESKDSKGNVSVKWKSTLNYTIQLINPSTGATESSYTYESSSSSGSGAETARKEAIANSTNNMSSFIEEAFPITGQVLQIAEQDAKKAKTVYINVGSNQGISKGQAFTLYETVDIAGEKSSKIIGAITVTEVMSGTRSLCKVTKGGDEVLSAMSKNIELTIKSRLKRFLGIDVL